MTMQEIIRNNNDSAYMMDLVRLSTLFLFRPIGIVLAHVLRRKETVKTLNVRSRQSGGSSRLVSAAGVQQVVVAGVNLSYNDDP